MNRRSVLPTTDRHRRHQLVFELVPASMLAVSTGMWALVVVAGLVCLPAVRATWVHWARRGIGIVPFGIAVLLAALWGPAAAAVVWMAGCGIGVARLGLAERGRAEATTPTGPKCDQRGPRTRT